MLCVMCCLLGYCCFLFHVTQPFYQHILLLAIFFPGKESIFIIRKVNVAFGIFPIICEVFQIKTFVKQSFFSDGVALPALLYFMRILLLSFNWASIFRNKLSSLFLLFLYWLADLQYAEQKTLSALP